MKPCSINCTENSPCNRDRFYIIRNGTALMKGGRPLRYSQTTLPATWKKALRGDPPQTEVSTSMELEKPAKPTITKKPSVKKEKEVSVMPELTPAEPTPSAPPIQSQQPAQKRTKASRKNEGKQAAQLVVSADCPYCSQKHDIPVEKGRSGKPFFHNCTKCQNDFAVRFVQVTMYQAQVAGFR